jgi:hypothetical protein
MRVADEHDVRQIFQSFGAPPRRECVAQGLPTQRMKHLEVHEVGNVKALDPLPDALGSRTGIKEHGDDRRGVEDDQGPLTKVAGIISVPQAADRHVRCLVQLDRLPPT